MSELNKQQRFLPVALFVNIVLVLSIICTGCRKEPSEQNTTKSQHPESSIQSSSQSAIDLTADKIAMSDVIKAARTWRPAYEQWFGKKAPEFTLTDVAGKEHKLSDYRGKDVILVFWATWCGPCLREIPHLIELRNTVSKEKLAMLAISNERPALVKDFVAKRQLNYTALLSSKNNLPNPYNTVNAIPSSFFIDPEGKIKLGTVGLLSLPEIRAILKAE